MFESNMMDNMQQINDLKAIQGDQSNVWRKLVTKEFTEYLDSISTVKQETTEENCDAD